jgi:tetratricopeptide (TPR) repeat protein
MLKDWIELHRQGRFAEAELGYRAWLEQHPNDADTLHLLGLLKHQAGQTAEALQLLERAHELAPEDPRIDLGLASLQLHLGNQDAAKRGFERALSFDPNLGGAHIGLGQIALWRGDGASAEQHFRIALRAAEDGHALAGLGTLALERSDYESALRYLTRAAELVPESGLIQFLLGQAFMRRDMSAFAEQAFTNALRLAPDMHAARQWLGELLLNARRPREAQAQYRQLQGIAGFEVVAHNGLADVARMEERLEDAVAEYRASLAIQPAQSLPARLLAWCLAALGRNHEVVSAYDAYLAHAPDDEEVRVLRADVLTLMERFDEAAEDWNHLLARDPGHATARTRLAQLDERRRRYESAVAHADFVLAAQPDEPEMLLLRARAQMRAGDDVGLRATLDRLSYGQLTEGQSRLGWNYYGRMYDRLGNAAEAARCFTEAQRNSVSEIPLLDEPRPELLAALQEPVGEPWPEAPILLLGLPGSGVERIAALLAGQPGLQVLRDRIGTVMRDDDFNAPRFPFYCGPLDAADVAALRERYLAPLRMAGIDPSRPVVDWLPRWDAHLLALVRRAMPGTRLVIVERDPRDTLLNWLAFGWAPNFACPEPELAATWLARGVRHLHFGAELDEPRRIVVAADPLIDDAPAAGGDLARFLGLSALQPARELVTSLVGLGDLPVRFPPGHWEMYREALAGPFRHFG